MSKQVVKSLWATTGATTSTNAEWTLSLTSVECGKRGYGEAEEVSPLGAIL